MDLNLEDRERPEKFTEETEPWYAFSTAIIKAACDDYKVYGGNGRQSIERFFRSEYFSRISNIDPEWLIRNLRETFRPKIGMVRGEKIP